MHNRIAVQETSASEVIKVCGVTRRPLPERWRREQLETVRAVPWFNLAPHADA